MDKGISTVARLSAARDLMLEKAMISFSESYKKAQIVAKALERLSDGCDVPEVSNMVVGLFDHSPTFQDLVLKLLKEQDDYHRAMQKELLVIERYCKLRVCKPHLVKKE